MFAPHRSKSPGTLTAALQSKLGAQTMVLAHRDALIEARRARIEKLTLEIARLDRWRFGKSTETICAEQLALWASEPDADIAQLESQLEELPRKRVWRQQVRRPGQEARQAAPSTDPLPRVEVRHARPSQARAGCGHDPAPSGEEISERLDVIPARLFVQRRIRPKYCCGHCASMHAAPLPSQPIDRGLPAPRLHVNVAIARCLGHQPLYRQEASTAPRSRTPFVGSPWVEGTGGLPAGKAPPRAGLFDALIETAKLDGVDPHAYLAHLFEQLPSATSADLDALMPWRFEASSSTDVVLG